MNYRHAFHAGNFADVFKHTLLIGLLDALRAKPAAFCYVDTHAGRGRYDLAGEEALRTDEAAQGVLRLSGDADLPAPLQRYLQLVRAFDDNSIGELRQYPGSPLLARALLREQDRAILCELQPDEAAALKLALRGDARCAVHQRDGYAALKALLPPPQKRGLVLIDPPFEAQAGEFELIQRALIDALVRWPNAIHAVWFPIKLRETILPFYRWLHTAAGDGGVLATELLLHPDNSPLRFNGCGVVIVNPPWHFEQYVEAFLPALRERLAQDTQGSFRIDWLKPAR
jgi:23S rRNA (adenine2030-N6)-methyltransferase